MANNYSTADIVKGVLSACGERTDGTSPYQLSALKYINNVYKNVISGANEFAPEIGDAWTWATQQSSFIQYGYYNNGTVSVTQYSNAGSFSAVPQFNSQNISLENYYLHVGDDNDHDWYRITAHVAGQTNFTLEAIFLEDTNAAASFRAAPILKDLGAGILRLIEPFRIYKNRILEYGETYKDTGQIYGISQLEMQKYWPLRFLKNQIPAKFCTVTRSESSWVVQFNSYATDPFKIDWSWIPIPDELVDSTTSIPIIPFEFRDLLVTGAAHYLLLDKSQGDKAQRYFGLTQAKLQAMHLSEEKMAKLVAVQFGQMTPRLDDNASFPWYYIQPQ